MNQTWMDDSFSTVNARYIKINITECDGAGNTASIYEAEVYGWSSPDVLEQCSIITQGRSTHLSFVITMVQAFYHDCND